MGESFREAEHAGWMVRADSYDALFSAITSQAIPHVLTALGDLAGKGRAGCVLRPLAARPDPRRPLLFSGCCVVKYG
jgi:hypothetical protein